MNGINVKIGRNWARAGTILWLAYMLLLGACAPEAEIEETPAPQATEPVDDEGLIPRIYWIGKAEREVIPSRLLDAANGVRNVKGIPDLALSPELNAAAFTHAKDMSAQFRPWHFGSDGSSPVDRAQRSGFDRRIVGENIAETFEPPLEVIGAWLDDETTRSNILDPTANHTGVGWHQDPDGRIWWVMVFGG